jgi:hypothetical protein
MLPRAILLLCAATLAAQPSLYRFSIDQDLLSGAPDFSFLNHPLTQEDKITVRDGKFVNALGQPVRFFGVNLAFSANFPTPQDAPRIAKRLRRLGINLVRLHHLDTQPDSNPANAASILTTGPYPTINPFAAERLRAFLDAMRAEGVYVNLNLKVGYEFRPAVDRVPAYSGTFPNQSKPLHIFEPRMVALQQEFTRKLIDSLKLQDDPVLAMVEINNESSLLYSFQTNQFDPAVTGLYRDEITSQWNRFLRSRYESTESLREKWGASEGDSEDILPNRWALEVHAGAQASSTPIENGIRINFTANTSQVIAKQVGFSITQGETYLAEMEIRAEQNTSIYWDVKQDVSPWATSAARTFTATPQWQRVTLPVTSTFSMNNIGRFGVQVARSTAPVEIRHAKLVRRGRRGLGENESLEAQNIVIPGNDGSTEPRLRDFVEFLASLDKNYLDVMKSAVRESTTWEVPVAGTQMNFSGLMTIDTHAGMDYQDIHFYIDHYNFPAVAWDGRDWRIRDSSNLQSGYTTLLNLAAARTAGQPYTVSEFNQNWPNTKGHELLPALSAFAAFQDWDGLMHFAYSHGRGWDANVPNGFNLNGDWSKWVSFGQSAWLFRSGAIATGGEEKRIPLPYADRLRFTRDRRNSAFTNFLAETKSIQPQNFFRHRVALDPSGESNLADDLRDRPPVPILSNTNDILWHQQARLFLLQAPQAAGIIGEWEGALSAGNIDVEPSPATGRTFRTVLLTSLDTKPIERSERLLLTNPGFTLRSKSPAQPAEPQRIVNYPNTADWFTVEPDLPTKPSGNLNGGDGPTWMERTDAVITLRTLAESLTVYPLDGTGKRLDPIPAEKLDNAFRFSCNAESPWYEIVAVVP